MTVHFNSPTDLFTSGDSVPLAELRPDLSELAIRYHLTLEEGLDDLGSFAYIVVPVSDGLWAMLMRYRESPELGTIVRVDSRSDLHFAWKRLRRGYPAQRSHGHRHHS